MKLSKKYLEVFFYTIKGTEGILSLSESRIRDSFIKPLAEATETYLKDRTKIYETFCMKKEDGTPDLLVQEKTTSYQFPPERLDEINKELTTLSEEEVDLDVPEKLKEILEKTDYKPKTGESELIDEILAKL